MAKRGPKGPHSGSFKPGNTAGVGHGRKPNTLMAEMDKIAQGAVPEIVKQVVSRANAGDMRASEMILRRAWPERKGRPVDIDIPSVRDSVGVMAAMDAVLQAVSDGRVSPEEGASVGTIIETQRKAIEMISIEQRLARLEANAPPLDKDSDE